MTRLRVSLALATLAALTACQPTDPVPTGYLAFHEPTYGYTFEYPDTLDVRAFSAEHLVLGREHGESIDAVVQIGVYTTLAGEPAPESFEAFALERARLLCDADGPGTAHRCTGVRETAPAQAGGELSGQVFYLRHETHDLATGQVAEDVRGPFFAFDVTPSTPQAAMAVLLVHPPVTLDPDDADRDLLRQITRTLRLEQSARPAGAPRP